MVLRVTSISPADAREALPEPWRFGCPLCGSVNIKRRVKHGDYRCRRCGGFFPKPIDRSYPEHHSE